MYFVYGRTDPHIWAVWFGLFLCESLVIMGVSSYTPGIEIADTHLSDRMQLLTLIIIGESVISVTRIVNKIVAGGGWTLWSFVHILGVTTTVVCAFGWPVFRFADHISIFCGIPTTTSRHDGVSTSSGSKFGRICISRSMSQSSFCPKDLKSWR